MLHPVRSLAAGLLLCIWCLTSYAQQNVGIGTNTPDASAILELQATDKGFLAPRTDTGTVNLSGTPATGLLIYQTTDSIFYYYNGIKWMPISSGGGGGGGNAWLITGNLGTTAGTNFIGTTDAEDFVTKTSGSSAGNERMRVTSAGRVVINNTSPSSADPFSVYGGSTTGAIDNSVGNWAINGYSGKSTAAGVYGRNDSTGTGVFGENTQGGTGVYGTNSGAGQGVYGLNSGINGIGVYGVATGTLSNAGSFYANNAGNTWSAVYVKHDGDGNVISAVNTTASTSPVIAAFNDGTGAFSRAGNFQNDNTANTNTALFAAHAGLGRVGEFQANNTANTQEALFVTHAGSGNAGYFEATNASNPSEALYTVHINPDSRAINGENLASTGAGFGHGVRGITYQSTGVGIIGGNYNTSGTGVAGYGNNVAPVAPAGGAGAAFAGDTTGVFIKTYTDDVGQGIEIQDDFGAGWFVGQWDGSQYLKIDGSGTAGTIIKDLNGNRIRMSASEAPENLFEDYGIGQLENGFSHIDIDPVFSKNIVVNEKHPLRVIIQPEGDCNGVYVTNKTQSGFDVVELRSGKSNTPFTYHVIANRADEVFAKGRVAKYSEARFAPALSPQKIVKLKSDDNDILKVKHMKINKLKVDERKFNKIITPVEKNSKPAKPQEIEK